MLVVVVVLVEKEEAQPGAVVAQPSRSKDDESFMVAVYVVL
jgi:hypothetical protein